MSGHLVDTNWIILHLAGFPEAMKLLEVLASDRMALSVITYMEVYEGLSRGDHPDETRAKFGLLVAATPILPVTIAIARRCAELRRSLRQQGKRVNSRALDLLIAATAIEHQLILVTQNTDDYRDIPGLVLY